MKKLEMAEQPGPNAELFREREPQPPAHERSVADSGRHARHAKALERLCSVAFTAEGLDKLLQNLIELFVEVAGSDVGVLRLREGDQLRSCSAVGLEDEIAAGFSSVLPSPSHNGQLADASSEVVKSESLRAKEMRTHHSLNLLAGETLVGVVVLGWRADRELSDDERQLLAGLGSHAAAAIRRAQAEEALRAAVTARDEVLSVVAHDLKNPINVIAITATGMVQRAVESSARRPIERILRGVERAERLLRDLLEINAIEAGRLNLDKRRLEPADAILAALESQQGVAEDASVIIATDLAPELPELEADEERVLEVFENLIGNAVKFTAPAAR